MKIYIALTLLSTIICVTARSAPKNSLTNLDLKKADDSASYCAQKACNIPVNTGVKIVFTLNVVTKVSDLIFTARIGRSQKKKVFENYHACLTNGAVVLQQADCQSKTLNPGTYTVSITAVLSTTKTNGKFIIGERTGKFVSSYYSVKVGN